MGSPVPSLQTAAVIEHPGPNGIVRIDDAHPVETPGKDQVLVKLAYSGIWYVLDFSSFAMSILMNIISAHQKFGHCSAGQIISRLLATRELELS